MRRHIRNDLCRWPFSRRANIRPGGETGGTREVLKSKLCQHGKTGQNTYPRPRPATYEAGAGIERNASLFLSDDMAHWLEMEI